MSGILSLTQIPADASVIIATQDNAAATPKVIVEVDNSCTGMCGTKELACRFRLFEDATAEYMTSNSSAYDPPKEHTLLKKSIRLSKAEYDQFINLAESSRFLRSELDYTGFPLVDALYRTDIIYKNGGTIKKIYLRNFFPSLPRSTNDPPDEVRQLLQLSYDLSDRIRKSGT